MLGVPLAEGVIWALWTVFAVGAVLAWCIAFTGPYRGMRCAGCGYDMEGLGASCPECGRRFRYAVDPLGRRRPWRLLPLAVACLLPAPAWTGWRDEIRQTWWLLAYPTWERVATVQSGSLEVSVLRGGRPGTETQVAYEVRRDGRRARLVRGSPGPGGGAWIDCGLADMATSPGLVDLTGDGLAEIVLTTRPESGEMRGFIVFDPTRGEQPIVDGEFYAPTLVAAAGDTPAHVIVLDTTLMHWRGSSQDAGLLPVALVWDGARLRADLAQTARAQGLRGQTVETLAVALGVRSGREASSSIHAEGWRAMASLIYAGRQVEAAELFARIWVSPETRLRQQPSLGAHGSADGGAGRDAFVAEFEARLRSSPWWPDLFGPGS